MKKVVAVTLAVLFLCVAQVCGATNTWSSGYPATGSMTGTISIEGSATLDSGYSSTANAQVTVIPVGGGDQIVQTFAITPGQTGTFGWGPVPVSGLTSGTSYNVIVSITQANSCSSAVINTDNATATAK